MGLHANAKMFFGYYSDSGGDSIRVPWGLETRYEGCDESWWFDVQGYKPPFEIWEDDGNGGIRHPLGITDEKVTEYYQHRRAWLAENPLPIEVVCCGHHEFNDFGIALPAPMFGSPDYGASAFKVSELELPTNGVEILKNFVSDYGIDVPGEPCWWLASHFG